MLVATRSRSATCAQLRSCDLNINTRADIQSRIFFVFSLGAYCYPSLCACFQFSFGPLFPLETGCAVPRNGGGIPGCIFLPFLMLNRQLKETGRDEKARLHQCELSGPVVATSSLDSCHWWTLRRGIYEPCSVIRLEDWRRVLWIRRRFLDVNAHSLMVLLLTCLSTPAPLLSWLVLLIRWRQPWRQLRSQLLSRPFTRQSTDSIVFPLCSHAPLAFVFELLLSFGRRSWLVTRLALTKAQHGRYMWLSPAQRTLYHLSLSLARAIPSAYGIATITSCAATASASATSAAAR